MTDLSRPASRERVVMLPSDAERRALIARESGAALVSDTLPLRANLSAIENITMVFQYRTNTYAGEANDIAWGLLKAVDGTGCADKRDPDLSFEERFLTKLLRAVAMQPRLILIDRPGQLLPDTDYPKYLNRTLLALDDRIEQCWILDYIWNKPLYDSRG